MKSNTRDKIVPVRLTQIEYKNIQNLANERGIAVSTFLRMAGISEVREHNKFESKRSNANSIKFKPKRYEIGGIE